MENNKNLSNPNTAKTTLTLRYLTLHNDNRHTFQFVMETLVEVCSHNNIQAEQCATIAHHKGKCDIMKGPVNNLKPMQEELISRGLIVTID